MRSLADEPRTDVLEYVYDSPERAADPQMVVKLAAKTVEARARLPRDMNVVKAAKRLCASDETLAQFSRTHPSTFMLMLDQDNCGRAMLMLEQLARLRKAVNQGMSEAEADVQASRLIMEKTMRGPSSEERSSHGIDVQV